MPDRRRHRGPHPRDAELFAPANRRRLAEAAGDFAWLLGRGYVEKSALKLVGDRYRLRERQRLAVLRSTCSDAARADRRVREVAPEAVAGETLAIDGYNVLITVEAALSGGVLLRGREGCLRDLASLHGTFKRVEETGEALERIGETLATWRVGLAVWYLDRPVSNSGRLAGRMREAAGGRGWPWDVRLVQSPDGVLRRAGSIVATADSVVLDRCGRWLNLAHHVVRRYVPAAAEIDFWGGT